MQALPYNTDLFGMRHGFNGVLNLIQFCLSQGRGSSCRLLSRSRRDGAISVGVKSNDLLSTLANPDYLVPSTHCQISN